MNVNFEKFTDDIKQLIRKRGKVKKIGETQLVDIIKPNMFKRILLTKQRPGYEDKAGPAETSLIRF